MSTDAVLNHHLQAFGAGDVDGIMQDYTEESVLITQEATIEGLDGIRAAFTGFFDGLFKPGTYDFTMDRTEIAGDVAYIAWHAQCAGAAVPLGTDTFLIRSGKIAVQTFAAQIEGS